MRCKQSGKNIPVQVQVTLEATGTMLLGTEIGAALTTLEMFDVAVIGMNCATGPKEMNDGVRYLGLNSPRPVSVLPNAGLPQNVGGHAVYKLQPQELGGLSQAVHHRVRRAHRRRLLRHRTAASEGCGRYLRKSGARTSRSQDDRRGGQRLLDGSSRPRSQAAGDRRGDEHHHACRALQEHGARAGL